MKFKRYFKNQTSNQKKKKKSKTFQNHGSVLVLEKENTFYLLQIFQEKL
jgi:hypothetical protein